MKHMQTEILVIGGGATGSGVLRDLAMRGFKAVLVEKGDLTHGTTGRYHGLLHSGGRYVVRDPQAARECIEENRILRRILPDCIEDTGGFFVLTPWDDAAYAPKFLEGCKAAGIPVEELTIPQMLKEEALLNPQISRCFRVPDGSADAFAAADLNAASARQLGALVLNYHPVMALLRTGERVIGARCHDLVNDEDVTIHADMVVNAAGAWAGKIANLAGSQVSIVPGKGVMVAVNHRIVNTVINRCKFPADGDILVPAHTVSVIGTTDVKVEDPDHFAIEPWEVHLMMEEGEKMIPGFKEMRMLRAWAGVRPLYQETAVTDTRDVTRAFVLLDHAQRDGLEGLVTITSGKWTTYRKMAEVTVNLVCQKLGVQRECRTHLEPMRAKLPGHNYLGAPLAHVEEHNAFGALICECELASVADVTNAIVANHAKTLDDIRRDVRLGMGPCQGGFCTLRAAGLLHHLRRPENPASKDIRIADTNLALRDFLQERWKGLLPILWGQQLRQERLDELIYLTVLNADHLPGETSGRLSPVLYEQAAGDGRPAGTTGEGAQENKAGGPAEAAAVIGTPAAPPAPTPLPAQTTAASGQDVLVIGAGLAGLTAAWQAAEGGLRTQLIAKGFGALYWSSGCIDVLGYHPIDAETPVTSPQQALAALVQEHPQHPYALAGLEALRHSLAGLQQLCAENGYPLHGSLERNWLLPSAVGAARPTCLAPETFIAGDLHSQDPMLIVGVAGFHDYYPELISDNLKALGIEAYPLMLELPDLRKLNWISGRYLSNQFDQKPEFCRQVAEAIRQQAGAAVFKNIRRVGLPAALGLDFPYRNHQELQRLLERSVFEIPGLPPSIPGMRLHHILVSGIEAAGGRVYDGMQVNGAEADAGGRLAVLWSEAAARRKPNRAASFILATGGLLGGGMRAEYGGRVHEVVCDLPVSSPTDPNAWLRRQFLGDQPHPIYTAGVAVNERLQPIGPDGRVIYPNLYAAGGLLAGFDLLRQRSLDGVALATGYRAGRLAMEQRK